MKLIIAFVLCSTIFVGNIALMATELSTLENRCCCEKNCECAHEKNTTATLRNVKCGDNVPGATHGYGNKHLISTTAPKTYIKKAQSPPRNEPLKDIKKITKKIIPPPPKKTA